MTIVVPFEPAHADQVAALWRELHPDWTWLDSREERAKILALGAAADCIGYVVQRGDIVVASVFSECSRDDGCSPDKTCPRNRFINIDARAADIAAEWLDFILVSLVDADRGQPGMWHVINTIGDLLPVLTPLLEAAGFIRHSSLVRMEWTGESVTAVDPGQAHLERYAGGNQEIDQAIVDLHNRSYRSSRLVLPVDLERLWKLGRSREIREYVLALDNDRVVGYAEWCVTDGKPWVNSLVAARSHWGTTVAAAAGTRAMQILLELGYHKIESVVRSNNAAAIQLNLKHGWKIASELTHTFVRRL